MRWQLQSAQIPETVEDLQTILAVNRGIDTTNPDALKAYLEPIHPNELTPEQLNIDQSQLSTLLDVLIDAKEKQQSVLIFGDYDADGICATAVLWQVLHAGGWKVTPFIPNRHTHGYGLSDRAISEILASEKQPDIIITVDNGIVAHGGVQRLEDAGIRVLVTDHHQPELDVDGGVIVPPATAVVFSTLLCGTTMGWVVARSLAQRMREDAGGKSDDDSLTKVVQAGLDLCGVATIADQVPLLFANRVFAWHGVKALQVSKRPGLVALFESASVDTSAISATTVNYVLAPRINAMGRLEHGMDALRLLCTKSVAKARELASVLSATNTRRQDVTIDQLAHARLQAQAQSEQHIIVAHSTEYHEGVIGLIAGRLVEEFGKPAIVLSVGESTSKASARSIHGINIVEFIREIRSDLLEVGGHPMAAGFGILSSSLELVTNRLHDLAKATISLADLTPTIQAECELPAHLLTLDTFEMISQFAPFGQRNPEPVFVVKGATIQGVKTLGKENQHIKLSLVFEFDLDTKQTIEALGWNQAQELLKNHSNSLDILHDKKIDVIGSLEINTWKNKSKPQLKIVDFALDILE